MKVKLKDPESYYQETSGQRTEYEIYDIFYKNGYPRFLLYIDGQWVRKSAKHFVPVD